MREHEQGAGPLGRPRGGPDRPLIEAALVLAAFYASAFLPFAPRASASFFASPAFHFGLIAVNALRAFLLLCLMASGEGLSAFDLGRFRRADPLKGLLTASGAFAAMVPPALLFPLLGITNPLLAGYAHGRGESLALIPLFIASSLSTGYAEELFFRSYLMRRLERAGLGPLWAGLASSLLFGSFHGAQGIVGIASTTLVGLWFARRWHKGRNIHELAIGHGLYDAAVFAITLYS
jgi:uncharacterized protein